MIDPRYQIKNCDCFSPEGFGSIPNELVDCIIADIPYGKVTKNEWDNTTFNIPLMFTEAMRVLKPKGTFCLFNQEPNASKIRCQFEGYYRYDRIWLKEKGSQFHEKDRRPIPAHENILIFSKKYPNDYFPQKTQGLPYSKTFHADTRNTNYGKMNDYTTNSDGGRFPLSYMYYPRDNATRGIHPTEKPVGLLVELVNSFSRPNGIILDFTMGSGSTLIAALKSNRQSIGFEIDPVMFEKAKRRIEYFVIHKEDNIEKIREMYKEPIQKGNLGRFLK